MSGATWSGVSRLAQQGLQTLSVAVLARLLSPADYGLVAMGSFFVNFLQQLGDLGTGSAVIQRETLSPRLVASLFWVNLILGVAGALILWAAAPAAAAYYREPRVVAVLSMLALAFPAAGIGIVPQSLLVRNMEYRKLCFAEVGSAAASTGVAITLAWQGAGVWALICGSVTLTITNCLLVWILSGWRPAWLFDWQEVRSVFQYSLNLTGFVSVNYFARNAGHLIVGRYLGPVALGYYQMAYSLLMYPLQALGMVLGRVFFAAFSRMQNDRERLRSAILRYLSVLGAVNAPVFLGLMVVAGPLVSVFLGSRWSPVVPLITILAPIGILQAVSSPAGQIYLAVGRSDLMFRVGVASTAVQLAGYLIGLQWGLKGVVLCYAISTIPVSCAVLLIALRLIDLPVGTLLRRLVPVVACSAAMAAAVLGWRHLMESQGWTQPVVVLASAVPLGVVAYGGLILVARPAFAEDLMQVALYSKVGRLRRLAGRYLGSDSIRGAGPGGSAE